MGSVLLPVALFSYIAGVFLAIVRTVSRSPVARNGASIVFLLAWGAHLGAVIERGLATGAIPLSSRGEYLLALGLAVMSLHLVIWFGMRAEVVGLVLPPLAALAAFAALPQLPAETIHPIARSGWFLFHAAVSTLGMATLVVALAMSSLYLFQDRWLKSRRALRLLDRLPPLDRCDQIGFRALLVGFCLLTIGIVTGLVVGSEVLHRLPAWGMKQTLAVLAWAVLAAVLTARMRLGFRGRKSAYLTITGVTLGLLTVVGMAL